MLCNYRVWKCQISGRFYGQGHSTLALAGYKGGPMDRYVDVIQGIALWWWDLSKSNVFLPMLLPIGLDNIPER